LRFPGQVADQGSGLRYNYHRDYDSATGRYVESDPIGLGGGVNTYAYAGGNPINNVDTAGLATVVIGSGPISSNPAGHVALAFTGQGVYSYGTADQYGASTTAYIQSALANRDVTLTTLNTTSEQEQLMMNLYNSNYGPSSTYSIAGGHDCANAALDALTAADALNMQTLSLIYNSDAPMFQFFPATVMWAAWAQPGSNTVVLPQSSAIPAAYQSFNK
jgi:RHS repeat-associated protein